MDLWHILWHRQPGGVVDATHTILNSRKRVGATVMRLATVVVREPESELPRRARQ